MTALFLAAVDRAGGKAGVAHAADHLVAVKPGRKKSEEIDPAEEFSPCSLATSRPTLFHSFFFF